MYYGDGRVALVFRDAANAGNYRTDIYNSDGKLLRSQTIDFAYTDISVHKDFIIAYNDTECEMYDLYGRVKYRAGFKEPMLLVVPGNSLSKWTLVNRDTVQSVRLN